MSCLYSASCFEISCPSCSKRRTSDLNLSNIAVTGVLYGERPRPLYPLTRCSGDASRGSEDDEEDEAVERFHFRPLVYTLDIRDGRVEDASVSTGKVAGMRVVHDKVSDD